MAKMSTKGLGTYMVVVIALLVVLAIIMLVVFIPPIHRRHRGYVSGMWTGDPTFLQKAGLKDMQMYIGPKGRDGTRQGYLIMTNSNGDMISNQAFGMTEEEVRTCGQSLRNHFGTRDKYTVDVEIQFDDKAAPPVMPADLTITISVVDGSMSIYNGSRSKLFAFLWKDMAASAAAARAYESDDKSTDGSDISDKDDSQSSDDEDD
jgi:hypothetical protein